MMIMVVVAETPSSADAIADMTDFVGLVTIAAVDRVADAIDTVGLTPAEELTVG